MRRRLLNVVTVVSLVLCVAAGTLWVRSYWVCDLLRCYYVHDDDDETREPGPTVYAAMWSRGLVQVFSLGPLHPKWPCDRWHSRLREHDLDRRHHDLSLLNRVGFYLVGLPRRGVIFPFWMVVLLTGTFPAVRFARWARRNRQSRAGHCPSCGYDLRATPERCPECGRTAETKAK